jgi:hypothetical protein
MNAAEGTPDCPREKGTSMMVNPAARHIDPAPVCPAANAVREIALPRTHHRWILGRSINFPSRGRCWLPVLLGLSHFHPRP